MSRHWSPSGVVVSVSSSVVLIASTSQLSGVVRITNAGASVAFVGLVTASATALESLLTPIESGVSLYLEYTSKLPYIIATATGTASALYAQIGYMLK